MKVSTFSVTAILVPVSQSESGWALLFTKDCVCFTETSAPVRFTCISKSSINSFKACIRKIMCDKFGLNQKIWDHIQPITKYAIVHTCSKNKHIYFLF